MLVVGIHAIESFIDNRCSEIKELLVDNKKKLNPRIHNLVNKSTRNGVSVRYIDSKALGASVALEVDVAWGAVNWWDWISAKAPAKIVLLDGVQDPHNLGACMRTACAFGVESLIIPARRAAPVNATALKVAAGAGAWLPVFSVNNMQTCLKTLKDMGYWLVACSEHADIVFKPVQHDKVVLIVGNEEKGVRSSVLSQADYLLRLPTVGPIKSLNVSVALGVALSHLV